MSVTCIAIDDEPLSLQLLQRYIAAYPQLQLHATFDDPVAGLRHLQQHPVDLLFIDINMPDISGLDLVRQLPHKQSVIFITAYREFAYEGFELDAIDYLLKPVPPERFDKAIKKALEYHQYKTGSPTPAPDGLFVRAEYQLVRIALDEIEYIESLEDYVKIHLQQGKAVMTLSTLKAIAEKLPPARFMRIHRSYIVPVAKIRSMVNNKVRLTDTELPVSTSYAAAVKNLVR